MTASSRLRARLAAFAIAAEVDVSGAVAAAGPTNPAPAAAPAPPAPIAAPPPPAPPPAAAPAPTAVAEEDLIPPNVQGAAVQVAGGGYCYGGPHPAPVSPCPVS